MGHTESIPDFPEPPESYNLYTEVRPGQPVSLTLPEEPFRIVMGTAEIEVVNRGRFPELHDQAGQTLALLPGEEVVVGRGRQADFTVSEVEASREHCRVSFDGDRITVEDLHSANGTSIVRRLNHQASLDRRPHRRPYDQEADHAFEAPPEATTALERLSAPERLRILRQTEIHVGPNEDIHHVSPELLQRAGLEPEFRVSLSEDVTCYVSKAFRLPGGRPAVVGYVEKDGFIVARSYYRSQSHGTWRYLPNHLEGWYGKGHDQASIDLPATLQKSLAMIERQTYVGMEPQLAERVFLGLSRIGVKPPPGASYSFEMSPAGNQLDGSFYDEGENLVPPEQLVFRDAAQEPDFSRALDHWSFETDLYGRTKATTFASRDGLLTYTFCRNERGQAWISAVEDTSRITSLGIRSVWIDAGGLTTPPMQYASELPAEYANPEIRRGRYVDAYDHYVSRIPLVRRYQALAS